MWGPETVLVEGGDTTPPQIAAMATPGMLWPPDGRFVEVTFAVDVADLCDPSPAVALLEVASSEPSGGRPGAQIQGAATGSDDRLISLRADRSGAGPGRTYLVTYRTTGASGNTATAGAVVLVPHDRGR